MRKTRKTLMTLYWSMLVAVAIVSALYESEVLEPGVMIGLSGLEFVLATVMELLTIGLIPLSLRLFKFTPVSRQLSERGADVLVRWGVLRILMLTVPLMVNTVLYYWFLSTAFGYMAIILLLCMAFVYPSASRCENEIMQNDDEKQ